jgi:hypothetical protein
MFSFRINSNDIFEAHNDPVGHHRHSTFFFGTLNSGEMRWTPPIYAVVPSIKEKPLPAFIFGMDAMHSSLPPVLTPANSPANLSMHLWRPAPPKSFIAPGEIRDSTKDEYDELTRWWLDAEPSVFYHKCGRLAPQRDCYDCRQVIENT